MSFLTKAYNREKMDIGKDLCDLKVLKKNLLKIYKNYFISKQSRKVEVFCFVIMMLFLDTMRN